MIFIDLATFSGESTRKPRVPLGFGYFLQIRPNSGGRKNLSVLPRSQSLPSGPLRLSKPVGRLDRTVCVPTVPLHPLSEPNRRRQALKSGRRPRPAPISQIATRSSRGILALNPLIVSSESRLRKVGFEVL